MKVLKYKCHTNNGKAIELNKSINYLNDSNFILLFILLDVCFYIIYSIKLKNDET
jgi:hypothetical protein